MSRDAAFDTLTAAVAALNPAPRERRWSSLSYCVADAVWSINNRYSSTTRVVNSLAAACGDDAPTIPADAGLPADPLPVRALLDRFDDEGLARVTSSQRTSARRTAPLKARAALQFATVLEGNQVSDLASAQALLVDPAKLEAIDQELSQVPGDGKAGIRRGYFWMLIGNDDLIKPDRMVLRWLRGHGHECTPLEARRLIADVSEALSTPGHRVTPWMIDHAIWNHQRTARSTRSARHG